MHSDSFACAVKAADVDGDGMISCEEFVLLFAYSEQDENAFRQRQLRQSLQRFGKGNWTTDGPPTVSGSCRSNKVLLHGSTQEIAHISQDPPNVT